jgi:hypothetical protein
MLETVRTLAKDAAVLERARVLFTKSIVTYVVAAAVAVAAFNEQISSVAPDGLETPTGVGSTLVAAAAAVWAIVRNVTPVIPADRGLISKIDWEAEIGELAESVDESDTSDEGV